MHLQIERKKERKRNGYVCLLFIPLCEALAAFTNNPSCIVCIANTIENNRKKQFLFILSTIIVLAGAIRLYVGCLVDLTFFGV